MEIFTDLKEHISTYYDQLILFLPKLFVGIIILTIFWITMRLIRRRSIGLAKTRAENPLMIQFLDSIFRIINIIAGALLFLYIIGLSGMAASILGAASLSAVVIGFAFKDIGENFIAGVILAFNSPFRLRDTVKTGDVEGSIISLRLRDTHIKTFDGKDVYVPNAQILKNPLFNYTIDGFLRKSFIIGVDYGTDIDQARTILLDNIKSIKGVINDTKPPRTHIDSMSSSTVNIQVHYWIDTFDSKISGFDIHTDAVRSSLNKLAAAGINMPGDIMEIKNYGDKPFMNDRFSKN